MEVIEAIKKRQSVRSYQAKKVPEKLIKELIHCAQWAPSACNLQLTEYIVVDDKNILSKLARQTSSKFGWSSTFIIFIYDSRFSKKKYSSLISLGACMENLLIAATSLGLSACPITGFRRDRVIKEILKIPKIYKIGLIMSIGYAQDENLLKQRNRLSLNKVMHGNFYENKGNLLNDSLNLNNWSFSDIKNYRQRIASVYLYDNHFKLHVFSENVYYQAVEIVKKYIKNNYENKTVELLDLISYDCLFLKYLADWQTEIELTATDYFSFPLEVIKSKYPEIKISVFKNNELHLPSSLFDIITFVHKIEFTPQVDAIFKEAYRLLRPGGILYITTSQERLVKKMIYKMNFYKKKYLNKEVINVYENNPYYKIGPVIQRNKEFIDNFCAKRGFKKKDSGIEVIPESGLVPHRFYWSFYEK